MDIQKINALITRKLEAEVCPVHGEHPVISWCGNNMQIRCCCDEFRAHICRISDDISGDAVREATDEEIDRLIRW